MDKSQFEQILSTQKAAPAQVAQSAGRSAPEEDEGSLSASVGQEVTLQGVAGDASQGAVVQVPGEGPVYLRGVSRWPADAIGKTVSVKGVLRSGGVAPAAQVGADGGVSHGISGGTLVIDGPTWTVEAT